MSVDTRIGIFAEDEPGLAESYTWTFEGFPDFRCIIIDAQTPRAFDRQTAGIGLERVDLVLADQYTMAQRLRVPMERFLRNLRAVNEKAWVIETTFESNFDSVYVGSNCAERIWFIKDVFAEAERLQGTSFNRIQYIIGHTSPALQQANDIHNLKVGLEPEEEKEERLNRSLQRAIRRKEINSIGRALGLGIPNLTLVITRLNREEKFRALHDLWNLIHHFEIRNNELMYGATLKRFQETLLGLGLTE